MERQTTDYGMHASWVQQDGQVVVTGIDGDRLSQPMPLEKAGALRPELSPLWDKIRLSAAGSNGCNAGRCFSPQEYDAWVRSLKR